MPRRTRFRHLRRFALLTGLLLVTACSLTALLTRTPPPAYAGSPQFADGVFRNPVPQPPDGLGKMLGIAWNMFLHKPANTVPSGEIPVLPLTRADLEAAPDRSLYRLGHSTVLMKLRGGFWITDPVFAERVSPVQWAGPKRFHAPPIGLAELPPLRGVILSHDHYDHLDLAAIAQLADKAEVFLTPLGVGDRLIAEGLNPARVRQLDWWQGLRIDGLQFTATPAQHFSGRGVSDRNRSLWASWVIVDEPPAGDASGRELRLFFSGDSGYFDGFREIGRRFGPFDLALVENGAYDAQWPYVHMQPEETLQAARDLGAKWLLPIHNSTFDLAMHPWAEPMERLTALSEAHGMPLATPRMGERVDPNAPAEGTRWWRDVDARD